MMDIFKKYLIDEFAEDYENGQISRREALKLLAALTGSALVASSILAACAAPESEATATLPGATLPPATDAPTTAPQATGTSETTEMPESATAPAGETTAPASTTNPGGDITFPGDGVTLMGYLAIPEGDGPHPAVLVCHENRGLTEHIKDVTRRLAQAGYAALAVDLLSREGGTSTLSSDQVPGILGNTSPDQFVSDFRSGWDYLKTLPGVDAERVGMVGFCFGGGVTWLMATRMPELRAAVPFYGPHPPVEDVPNIQAAVLGIYAGNDQRINQGIPPIEQAMIDNNKIYEKVIYPDTDHAFHNDTGSRYNAEAATDAWTRTLDWFAKYI
jgi:carboxymethylenebutenolidase